MLEISYLRSSYILRCPCFVVRSNLLYPFIMMTISITIVCISSTSIYAGSRSIMKLVHVKRRMKNPLSRLLILFNGLSLHCNIFLLSTIESLRKKWMIFVHRSLKIIRVFGSSISYHYILIYWFGLSYFFFHRLAYFTPKVYFLW